MSTTQEVPKYVAVQRTIREAIRAGWMRPGDRLPPEPVLARELGVSYMTLRRAFSDLVDEGILERRQGVGTFVRALRGGSNLGFLIFHVTSPDHAPLSTMELEILRHVAAEEGRLVRPMLLLEPFPPPRQIVNELRGMEVGVLGVVGFLNTDAEFIKALMAHFPCVLFNKKLPGVNAPYAAPDALMAARLCADYFVAQGRKHIAVALLNIQHSLMNEFSFAMEGELIRRGLAVDRGIWFEGDRYGEEDKLRRWIEAILARPDAPDALVLPTHEIADYAKRIIEARGGTVGRDMDIICFYSGSRARAPRTGYPRLLWNYDKAAEAAAQMMLSCFRETGVSKRAPVIRVAPELLLPESDKVIMPGW